MDTFTSKQASYNSIDFIKFIMAFCVVAIHTNPLINCSNRLALSIYDSIVELAVPFFFIVSGFLMAKKFDGKNNTVIIYKQMKKILKMYLLWNLIYSPLEIYHSMSSGVPLVKEVFFYIRDFVFVGQHYNSWPLWYLLSSVYGFIFIYILTIKKTSTLNMFLISLGIMLISFGFDFIVSIENLSGILYAIQKIIRISIANGRILQGLFFIPFGIILAKKELKLSYAMVLFVFGFLGNCLFDGFWGSFFLVICSVGFFKMVLSVRLPYRTTWIGLRKVSTIIYLIHMYVWTFYYTVIYGEKTYGIDSFLFTSLISLLGAIIFLVLRHSRIHVTAREK